MINVTKSAMPDYDEYCMHIKELWKTRHLTNNGVYLQKLEQELKTYLHINNLILVQNGTLALMLALEALKLPKNSEIITTPFTFAATATSIVWQNYKPVFVDIDPDTFNIDYKKIEENITQKTRAVLAVHVFGNPCNISEIEKIAQKHNLFVIYDAAHCFGVEYNGKNILDYGDLSTISFHATKIYHTIEGGAIITNDMQLNNSIKSLINFGFKSKYEIDSVGINAKMNEFEAIMGLLNLNHVDKNINRRKMIYETYKKELKHTNLKFQKLNCNYSQYNFSYFPIVLETNSQREQVVRNLNEYNIYPRKYFYPSINDFQVFKEYSKEDTPFARNISNTILCLPIYPELENQQQYRIIDIIKDSI